MTHGIPVSTKKTLWGKIQGIHKREECHSNVGDVEDPICSEFVHMKKVMEGQLTIPNLMDLRLLGRGNKRVSQIL